MSARVGFGKFGMLTSRHDVPWLRESLINPLFVPTQMIPADIVDGENDSIAPAGPPRPPPLPAAATGAPRPPAPRPAASAAAALSEIVKSGPSFFQCMPPS